MIKVSQSDKAANLKSQGSLERRISAESELGKALAQTKKEIRGSFDQKRKFQATLKPVSKPLKKAS